MLRVRVESEPEARDRHQVMARRPELLPQPRDCHRRRSRVIATASAMAARLEEGLEDLLDRRRSARAPREVHEETKFEHAQWESPAAHDDTTMVTSRSMGPQQKHSM